MEAHNERTQHNEMDLISFVNEVPFFLKPKSF